MPSEVTDQSFLEEYEREEIWAARFGICRKTAARYRNKPNGLPFLKWGGVVYIPKREGADFIRSRVRRRNPRDRRSTRNRAEAEFSAQT
jgi:hypothetical protein